VIRIRRLSLGDEREVGRVAEIWYSGKGAADARRRFLSDQYVYLLAAYADEELAGFLVGYELNRLDTSRPMMTLYRIDVLPRFQKRGVGKRLVNELKRICRRKGVLKMFVITSESNQAAMALYSSTGGVRGAKDEVVFVYKDDHLFEESRLL